MTVNFVWRFRAASYGGLPGTTYVATQMHRPEDQIVQDVVALKAVGRSVPEIMKSLKLGRATVYKYLKIHEEAQHLDISY